MAKSKEKLRITPGIHSVNEALNIRPHAIKKIEIKESWQKNIELKKIVEDSEKKNISIKEVSGQKLTQYCESHQGVAAHISESPELDIESLKNSQEPAIIVVLDEVEDPHNLGAILRTSWLLGVKGVVVTERRSAHLTPTACKVACGGAEHVPVLVEPSLFDFINELKEHGFWSYGLGAEASSTLWTVDLPEKTIWVLGAESKGLRSSTEKACDQIVSIPQTAVGASFNVSVAGAMALGETVRQLSVSKK